MNLYVNNKDRILSAGYAPAPFMLDYRRKLSIATLTNYLIHTAELHAQHNGFGIDTLESHSYSWVLIRLAIELKQAIHGNSTLEISTWIDHIAGITIHRCFELKQDGKVIGHAYSIWSAIDVNKRSPVRMSNIFTSDNIVADKPCEMKEPEKLKAFEPTQSSAPFEVGYSSMDINRHLNSARYIERCFDLLPLQKALPEDGYCKRVVMNFNKEALFGDRLVVHYTHLFEKQGLFRLEISHENEDNNPIFSLDYYI